MHRQVTQSRVLWARFAVFAASLAGWSVRSAPGVLGVGLLCFGAGMIYRPAGLIVGGLFLLLLDKRMPS